MNHPALAQPVYVSFRFSNVLRTKFAGKPMSTADYERVERDLQEQLTNHYPRFEVGGLHTGRGWATGALDDAIIDEEFIALKSQRSCAMYESAMSTTSLMESSVSSSFTSTCTESTSRTRRRGGCLLLLYQILSLCGLKLV